MNEYEPRPPWIDPLATRLAAATLLALGATAFAILIALAVAAWRWALK